jgi:hypothetical protein
MLFREFERAALLKRPYGNSRRRLMTPRMLWRSCGRSHIRQCAFPQGPVTVHRPDPVARKRTGGSSPTSSGEVLGPNQLGGLMVDLHRTYSPDHSRSTVGAF